MEPHAKSILLTLLLCFIAAAIDVTLPQPIHLPVYNKARSVLYALQASELNLAHKGNSAYKTAAEFSATNLSPGRRHQRSAFEGLALELAVKGQNGVVSL